MMDCKKALQESKGNFDKAIEILRKKGLADLEKKSARIAKEGRVEAYIHAGGKIGVLLEINCETDFVANNDDFKQFAHDVAMQIAAAKPTYISREEVPDNLIEAEKSIYRDQALREGKPENVVDKIIAGRLEKFYQTVCLMDQTFIKDDKITIQDYLGSIAAKLGENINIKRFCRYQLGE